MLNKRKKIFVIVGLVLLAIGIVFVLFSTGVIKRQGSRIRIESNPASTVYINGEQVGRTPYEQDSKNSEIVIKLIPDSTNQPLAPYETKVVLTSGVKTIVRRNFGETAEDSSGEVISFEKSSEKEPIVSVISTPDGAQVQLDGQIKGVTPIKLSSVLTGSHELSVSASGYAERKFSIQTVNGYRLTAVVQLAYTGEKLPSLTKATPEPAQEEKKEATPSEVEILNTPVGFLRVRSEPSVTGSEVGRATPGKKYKYISKDDKSGWFKIELEAGKEGWVSNEYATASATTQ